MSISAFVYVTDGKTDGQRWYDNIALCMMTRDKYGIERNTSSIPCSDAREKRNRRD